MPQGAFLAQAEGQRFVVRRLDLSYRQGRQTGFEVEGAAEPAGGLGPAGQENRGPPVATEVQGREKAAGSLGVVSIIDREGGDGELVRRG